MNPLTCVCSGVTVGGGPSLLASSLLLSQKRQLQASKPLSASPLTSSPLLTRGHPKTELAPAPIQKPSLRSSLHSARLVQSERPSSGSDRLKTRSDLTSSDKLLPLNQKIANPLLFGSSLLSAGGTCKHSSPLIGLRDDGRLRRDLTGSSLLSSANKRSDLTGTTAASSNLSVRRSVIPAKSLSSTASTQIKKQVLESSIILPQKSKTGAVSKKSSQTNNKKKDKDVNEDGEDRAFVSDFEFPDYNLGGDEGSYEEGIVIPEFIRPEDDTSIVTAQKPLFDVQSLKAGSLRDCSQLPYST